MDIRPAIPVALDIDTDRVMVDTRTGERITSYEQVYTEYDVDRIRLGYCCIHCGEAQLENGLPVAFPEACWVCRYPMDADQRRRFAEEFEGYTTIGPTRSIEELRAEDDEAKEKARREREGKPNSSIWIPG